MKNTMIMKAEQFQEDLLKGKKSLNDLREELGLKKLNEPAFNTLLKVKVENKRVVNLIHLNREEFSTETINTRVLPAITDCLNELRVFNYQCANTFEEYEELVEEDCELIKMTINNYIDAMGKAMLHLGESVDRWKK
ncbi:hypothetical protein BUE63_15555 [Bacillus sp. MB353a]|uniref:hypothetical protein n=1 Tax=Bacillus sp. MB353a TaxID=1982041 RepID=UPI000B52CD6F|nr:hypothetical protein [Bacillus sp. MB353a]OWW08954.1 hypothetical protein BUE63_15555 [Bacillus sp. MB353a]